MKWINILHLYQPPTQTKEIIDQVTRESYEKILSLLDQYKNLRLTLNVSGSLLELFIKYGHENIIKGLKFHAERGAVEFLGSAMYHPILPLLSPLEIMRQIELNDQISKKCFGDIYKPQGFYFPEMAYSQTAGEVVVSAGFKWTILDEIHATKKIDFERRYKIKSLDLGVVFRDSSFSKTFPPESIVKDLEKIKQPLITCHDGEMYGHWHKGDYGYYEKAFNNPKIETETVTEYRNGLPKEEEEITIRDASWESKPEELEAKIALGLWNDPRNEIHTKLEAFKKEVLTLVESHQNDPGYHSARHHADRGVSSCAWWWASEKKIGPFSPVSWNPTEIEKGAQELYAAVKSLTTLLPQETDHLVSSFKDLRTLIWKKHKEKYDPNYLVE